MNTSTYSYRNYDIFIGLDVDKSSISMTVKDFHTLSINKKIPADPEHLCKFINNQFSQQKVVCAYEAGPTGFYLHDYLKQEQIPCFVLNPLSLPHASNEYVKNNRLDSARIAGFMMSQDIKPIHIPDEHFRELRHLVRIRENYAYLQKASKQRIKALLLQTYLHKSIEDIKGNWPARYLRSLQELSCTPAVRQRLDALLADYDYSRRQLVSNHKQLRDFVSGQPEIIQYIQYLKSIPGIGFTIAVTVLGKIGDPQRIQYPQQLAGFCGLAPSERSTGDKVQRGHISHLGDKTLRFMLIEAAWVAITKDTTLRQFYQRIKSRNQPGPGSKIAITAVARKITQIIYRVLKDQRDYIQL